MEELSPELLLDAYRLGMFPMAESKESTELLWFHPEWRGVMPLEDFHVPRSLRKFMRKNPFHIRIDADFPAVIRACAEESERREDSWINEDIIRLYTELWQLGFAHSVECYDKGLLVGGLYGVHLGGAFFGESMFSRVPNASKVTLVHLVNILKENGFVLLDTQFVTEHLRRFGAVEIPRATYMAQLERALRTGADFKY